MLVCGIWRTFCDGGVYIAKVKFQFYSPCFLVHCQAFFLLSFSGLPEEYLLAVLLELLVKRLCCLKVLINFYMKQLCCGAGV